MNGGSYFQIMRPLTIDKSGILVPEFPPEVTDEDQDRVRNSLIWIVCDWDHLKHARLWPLKSPYYVGIFMLGRGFSTYDLYVGGRSYPWGKDTDIDLASEHVAYCVDIEAGMYGNQLCLDYLEKQREKRVERQKWLDTQTCTSS